MKLKKIKPEKCPYCGSEPIAEEKMNFDSISNDTSEVRLFDCGLELSCGTGKKEVTELSKCKNSDGYKKRASKRVEALKELYLFIEDLDVDREFKSNLRTAITFETAID